MLRARGWSLAAIAAEVGVAKSSVSRWTRGLPRGPALPPGALPLRAVASLPLWTSGRTRRCGRCGVTLPDVSFTRSGTGRQWWCRRCFAAYFRGRADAHRRQVRRAKSIRRDRARAMLMTHLRAHPCDDCGEADLVVLECDHVGPKTAEIARLVGDGACERLAAELTACEVVCANCHRRRTARRAGWVRAAPDWEQRLTATEGAPSRNLRLAYLHLVGHGCADCRTRDLVVLEFDHIGPKRGDVMLLARNGVSPAVLAREIAACVVRCANCHRRMTSRRASSHRVARTTLPGPS